MIYRKVTIVMDESKIAQYLNRYLENSNVLSVTDSDTLKRLKRYVSFCEKTKTEGHVYQSEGRIIFDDQEVELDKTSCVMPAGRLLDALEYIPDLYGDIDSM